MKLLALTVNKDDTTSFYRASGVMRDLQRKIPELQIDLNNASAIGTLTWSTLCLYDMVFLQRPFNSLNLVRFLRQMNIPVWIDYDDNLFEIPQDNSRAFDTYQDQNIQTMLIEMAKIANVVTVSTAGLKTVYDHFNKDVRVVPNAINFDLIGEEPKPGTSKIMYWRGGDSHRLDLAIYLMQIMDYQSKYADWKWIYAGYNPWEINLKNKVYRKPQDPVIYFQQYRADAAMAMHVPLHDSYFNHCKSNIAALEGIWGGAVCLVPDWEEWQIPGTIRYKTIEQYGEGLKTLLNEEISFNKYRSLAMEYIRDNYALSKINELRAQIVRDLMDQKR